MHVCGVAWAFPHSCSNRSILSAVRFFHSSSFLFRLLHSRLWSCERACAHRHLCMRLCLFCLLFRFVSFLSRSLLSFSWCSCAIVNFGLVLMPWLLLLFTHTHMRSTLMRVPMTVPMPMWVWVGLFCARWDWFWLLLLNMDLVCIRNSRKKKKKVDHDRKRWKKKSYSCMQIAHTVHHTTQPQLVMRQH